MPVLIQHRRTQILGGGKALVELGRGNHLVQQCLRHRRAVLIMLGVVLQDGWFVGPHFVDLQGKLDEVARHAGAGEIRVFDVGEHAVQRMPELMEHGGHFVPGQQRGLAGRRFGDVEVIGHHRLESGQLGLRHIGVHPCATALGLARIHVGDEDRQLLAVGVEHVVDGDVVALGRRSVRCLKVRPYS